MWELCDKERQDKGEMDQASLASIHESKTLAGIFQHIVDDCRVMKKDRDDDLIKLWQQ